MADPVVFIAGGPGITVTDSVGWRTKSWAPARQHRDLVFIDARGTSGRDKLECALTHEPDAVGAYVGQSWSVERFRACHEELSKRADLSQYTTPDIADDLIDILGRLGYRPANFVGSSYGSRVLLDLMARYGSSVRSGVTIGLATLSERGISDIGTHFRNILDYRMRQCEQDAECRDAYPGFAEKFLSIVRRLEDTPLQMKVTSPASGATETLSVNKGAFLHVVRSLLYDAQRSALLPELTEQVYAGNHADLLTDLIIRTERAQAALLSEGSWASIQCSEDFRGTDINAAQAAEARNLYGMDRIRNISEICSFWPQGQAPTAHLYRPSSDRPLLILNGTADPATPLAWAQDAQPGLKNSTIVAVRDGSHSLGFVWDTCLVPLATEFFDTLRPNAVYQECLEGIPPPRFRKPDGQGGQS
ncbi:alpha/beta hydrolase [Kordiimonas gwangyangensis]|uniref:alpha/beta hydrolase n=1 Tax=Kordiimonas gwangyangensis TaxID=288022 RepID=UPI0004721E3E|nr:alpha/beta fold hydrolase [Kordiimonas gwangyangensis]